MALVRQRSLTGCSSQGHTESDTTEAHTRRGKTMQGLREKVAVCKARREASEETNPADILRSDFVSRTATQPACCFVMAALAG